MTLRLLLIETSGRAGLVALAEGESLLATRRLDESRHQARDLAPAIADLLASAGWKPRDVSAIVVSRGPGSYTGLRVGVMSAKAFAYAAGGALLAIDTFAVIASQAPADANPLDVIADAQQQKVYLQRFERGAPVSPLVIRPAAEWLAEGPAPWASGPGLRLHQGRLPATVRPVQEALWEPRAESLLALALKRWHAGERDDPFAVEPLYLRPSSAEEQWQARPASPLIPIPDGGNA
ncbi:MAG TPA: tRNA (adenosine(37)-N6)-threonylcarbamoyltransferase complex dimerization subunit type 1 TsaB [Gemmataceae bacterium]|nr:tRNA (adenosine(37)-N6)-threonylcarbamoyltransferase complex dimerization subunit type 1 TsaB [Gemmataceae bacterium]